MLHYQPAEVVIKQFTNAPTADKLAKHSYIAILVDTSLDKLAFHTLPNGDLIQQRWKQSQLDKKNDAFTIQLDNNVGTRIFIWYINPQHSAFQRLTTCRKNFKSMLSYKPEHLMLLPCLTDTSLQYQYLEATISTIAAQLVQLPVFKRKPEPQQQRIQVDCYNVTKVFDFARTLAEADGNGLTRFLCNLPSNYLYPESYRAYVTTIAERERWTLDFYGTERLKKMHAGAFLAVIAGSPRPDGGILHLSYKPKNATHKIALVGKGMCFDTGGYNLKTGNAGMYDMKHDMTGSAVALGTLLALTRLRVPFQVDAYLALAENHIGPHAYKPSDVVLAANDTYIEVIDTDAEGRMVLADTLYLASKAQPHIIIDYATLTGNCVRTFDALYSGCVTNQPTWYAKLIELGQQSGERIWPLPYTEDYDEVLKSDIADIKQCHNGNADAIRAARFMGKFIQHDCPWIHIDLSAHDNKHGLAHIASDTTGFGVRISLALLLDGQLYKKP